MDSKKTSNGLEVVSVTMRPELAQRARVRAALAGLSRSAYIRAALELYMGAVPETQTPPAVTHEQR